MVITQSLKVAQELRCTSNTALIYMKEKVTMVQAKVLADGPNRRYKQMVQALDSQLVCYPNIDVCRGMSAFTVVCHMGN